jgi:hypothetical protein
MAKYSFRIPPAAMTPDNITDGVPKKKDAKLTLKKAQLRMPEGADNITDGAFRMNITDGTPRATLSLRSEKGTSVKVTVAHGPKGDLYLRLED